MNLASEVPPVVDNFGLILVIFLILQLVDSLLLHCIYGKCYDFYKQFIYCQKFLFFFFYDFKLDYLLFFLCIIFSSYYQFVLGEGNKDTIKSLLFLRTSSFLIASLALCKLSKITKFSLAKLKPPNSIASFISFSNLFLWFSSSAKDLSSFSSVSLSFSSILVSFALSFFSGQKRILNDGNPLV